MQLKGETVLASTFVSVGARFSGRDKPDKRGGKQDNCSWEVRAQGVAVRGSY